MKDIAIAAGTSYSTVSRVLNGVVIRDSALAERIRAIAHEMNYQPNEAGRSLRMGADEEYGPAFETRSRQDLPIKRAIATSAAGLVEPSDVIALDSGSTVAQLVYYLPSNVLVYTNSLAVLQPAARRGIHVHLAPGLYVPAMAAVFGEETDEYFRRHPSNVYFLSSARVDIRTGLFNLNPSTYSVKRAALANAGKKVLLVHHDKFCDASLQSFAPLADIDVIVTDYVPQPFRDVVLASGVHVIETGQPEKP
ncbi:LacI family DNA-binding transcriptional regulator [Alicyclobacillus cycloheptanicus]|uniref:DeoR/GlpR family transcriptional regulator of sugar metabolism n=1 Tax=Alicyclobacillus cycloheptanicus TaxID=1457 RepID=A0ABT9XFG6_9BACL|nr:LacI family DNA-binding transcriptional regulator [Alicyclobacillus cycloheptanicus]MDQ0189037.1 DeoR/GlpR family transcriptional regulator of sugar metabolism [Alicyclobacillus cycloheptanicus]WDM00174.1 LacI family DNA-binding transcriptional regulator [Alicyclobacillus cycloheptanicus]